MHRQPPRTAGPYGIEPALDIAGPGTRSYAFVIDWHVRLLLALGWLLAAWLIASLRDGTLASLPGVTRSVALAALVPAAAIYFLYHPVLELAMRGRTPGKRMAGVRIVTLGGGTPGIAALLVRNVLRPIDSLPLFYLVGLMSCAVTARHVRIGDLAAGTLLVHERGPVAGPAPPGLPPAAAQLIRDLLERWPELERPRRAALARAILERIDPGSSASQPGVLGDPELEQRLRALLAAGPPAQP